MSTSITSHGGHAYAPGFEPGAWDAFVAYFSGSSFPVEPVVALICSFALVAVMVSRIREKGRKRRRKTALFPSVDGFTKSSGSSVTLRPKSRKRTLEEKGKVFDDWVA